MLPREKSSENVISSPPHVFVFLFSWCNILNQTCWVGSWGSRCIICLTRVLFWVVVEWSEETQLQISRSKSASVAMSCVYVWLRTFPRSSVTLLNVRMKCLKLEYYPNIMGMLQRRVFPLMVKYYFSIFKLVQESYTIITQGAVFYCYHLAFSDIFCRRKFVKWMIFSPPCDLQSETQSMHSVARTVWHFGVIFPRTLKDFAEVLFRSYCFTRSFISNSLSGCKGGKNPMTCPWSSISFLISSLISPTAKTLHAKTNQCSALESLFTEGPVVTGPAYFSPSWCCFRITAKRLALTWSFPRYGDEETAGAFFRKTILSSAEGLRYTRMGNRSGFVMTWSAIVFYYSTIMQILSYITGQ